ncbi:hypothetical protein [Undibacterium macrobrachii]|jgi:hypothetical protein|uniref:DUF4926 domain-containing protein n=1 Tax=Undibacterium macrobrachii TaxID=1119058 RepID=A0ABQ2XE16_9BURK|nr:hypothetical protein [Undibacterium macrobrachii]GGX11758.1 hypothetical protein GCM10011282_17780 [Undibacterium macrobrachii]
MNFKIYDVVRLLGMSANCEFVSDAFNLRVPKVGDVATIVEVYEHPPGYILECCDQTGASEWMLVFEEKDVQLELVNI